MWCRNLRVIGKLFHSLAINYHLIDPPKRKPIVDSAPVMPDWRGNDPFGAVYQLIKHINFQLVKEFHVWSQVHRAHKVVLVAGQCFCDLPQAVLLPEEVHHGHDGVFQPGIALRKEPRYWTERPN